MSFVPHNGRHPAIQRRDKEADLNRRTKAPDGNIILSLKPPFITSVGSIISLASGPILTIKGKPLLSIDSTEFGALALSGRLFDASGRQAIRIDRNVLRVCAGNWDVQLVGSVMTVRSDARQIAVEIQIHPPHGIHVRRIHIEYNDWKLINDDQGSLALGPDSHKLFDLNESILVNGGHIACNESGIQITGGFAMDSGYNSRRLQLLTRSGKLDVILNDFRREVLHVVGKSGNWHVQSEKGVSLSQHISKAEAQNWALEELHKDANLRMLIHHENGNFESIFGDELESV